MKGHHTFKRRKDICERRRSYECVAVNPNNETIIVELARCDLDYKHTWATGYIWKKNGRIDGTLDSYWHVDTYVYRDTGECFGGYNPFEMSLLGKPERNSFVPGGVYTPVRPVIDFEWLLEATDENADVILDEVYRRFMAMEKRHISPESYAA